MTDSSTAKIYDAFAKHYREYSEKKLKYISGVDQLIEQSSKGRVKRVLDYGSGDGVRGAALFRKLEAEVLVQGDISQEMIQRCRDLGVAKEVWDFSTPSWNQQSEKFDLIVSLWNVFGHIPNMESRVDCLKKMGTLLSPQGKICLDVNNRHYRGYGAMRVQWRRLLDWIRPDYSRGDVHFDWNIDGQKYPAHGHLFTKRELGDMVAQAGFKILDWKTVDYSTGQVHATVTGGQHFLAIGKS